MAPSPPPRDLEVELDEPLDAEADLSRTVRRLRVLLDKLERDPNALPREVAQVAASVTGAMRLLSKLQGPPTLTEAAVLRSEPWQRIREATLRTLEAFPDALAALTATWATLAE